MIPQTNPSIVSVLVAAALVCASAIACQNTAPTTRRVSAAERGRTSYEAYCSECHGATGRGDGPLASGMEPRPTDLTTLAGRWGGFQTDRVAAYIDGRIEVQRHGPRDMPVWGRKLDDRMESALEQELRLTPQTILEIVAYLETQQVR